MSRTAPAARRRSSGAAARPADSTAYRRLCLAASALVVVALALACLAHPSSNDLFIQLRVGADILDTRRIPTVDVYSAMASGRPFLAHEWLASVAFATLDRLGGEQGPWVVALSLLFGLSCIGLMVLSLDSAHRQTVVTVPLLIASMLLLAKRLEVRPHLFTLALIAAYALAFSRWRTHRRWRDLLALVPLQALWVNLHGEAPMGIALAVMNAFGVALLLVAPRLQRREPAPYTRAHLVQACAATVALILASLCNPHGWRLFTFSLGMIAETRFMKQAVLEWRPTLDPAFHSSVEFWIYVGLLLLAWLGVLRRWKTASVFEWLLVLLATFVSTRAIRFVVYVPLLCFPIIVRSATDLVRAAFGERALRRQPWLEMALAAAVIATVLGAYARQATENVRFGWHSGGQLPYEEVEFMKAARLQGNVYCEYDDGALIIYRLHPDMKPVIDSRIDIYGEELFREWDYALESSAGFLAYADKYDVRYVLLPFEGHPRVFTTLVNDHGWTVLLRTKDRFLLERGAR